MNLAMNIGRELDQLPTLVEASIYAGGAALLALGAKFLIYFIVRRVRDVEQPALLQAILRRTSWASSILAPLLAVVGVLELAGLKHALIGPLSLILTIGTVAATVWLVIGILRAVDDHVSERFQGDSAKDRRFRTQARLVRRFVSVTLLFLAGIGVLLAIPQVRSFGISIFASAGVLGIIVAIVARPVLANVIAGVQLAFQEPFEIGDMIKIESEVGWIEDIHWTYVIVRRWDERRAVIPLSGFVDSTYENWSFTNRKLIVTSSVHADYSVPLDEIREELKSALGKLECYEDGEYGVDMIDAGEHSVVIRAKAQIEDPTEVWTAEFFMRETLVNALNKRGVSVLPRTREQHIDQEVSEKTNEQEPTPQDDPTGGKGTEDATSDQVASDDGDGD